MTYKRFLEIILLLQREDRKIRILCDNGVDLINFVDSYYKIISELIKEIYGEEGYSWFSWYCYENEYGQRDWSSPQDEDQIKFGAYDNDGQPICYSHDSLWQYLEENYK
jgi:hypothetical protein